MSQHTNPTVSRNGRFLWLLLALLVASLAILLFSSLPVAGRGSAAVPQGSAFLYQGLLNYQGAPANGNFDFAFRLFDGPEPGIDAPVGAPITMTNVAVTNGVFTATLDFGVPAFSGEARWLETQVRPAGVGGYVALRPIEPLTAVPYALNALNGPNTGLVLNGTTLELTDATGTLTVTLASLQDGVDDADPDPANEHNTGFALNGTTLAITDTGSTLTADLSSLQDGVDDADNDPTNEYNIDLALIGTTLMLTDTGGTLTADLSGLGGDDADSDPTNEHNTGFALNGTTLAITDTGSTLTADLSSLQDGVDDADNDPTNEYNLDLALIGTTLTLTDTGGTLTADLSSLQDGVDDADNDPTNEYNLDLALIGTTLTLTDTGGTLTADLSSLQDGVDDADNDPTNEYNLDLALIGTTLTLTDTGGTLTADLSSLQDGVDDADNDPTNEYNLDLALIGTTLTLTDTGGTLTADLSSLQDGVDDADNDPTNEYNLDLALIGTTLTLTDTGGTLTADLSSLQDGVDDADNDPTNEHNTDFDSTGTTLAITDTGSTLTVDLDALLPRAGRESIEIDRLAGVTTTQILFSTPFAAPPAVVLGLETTRTDVEIPRLTAVEATGFTFTLSLENSGIGDVIDGDSLNYNVGLHTSVAVVGGNPAISYYDVTNQDLKYAAYVGTGGNCGPGSNWQCDTIDSGGAPGQFTSLAEVGGNPAISYSYNNGGAVKYAAYVGVGGNCGPGNSWQCDTIDSGGSIGQYTSLTVVGGNPAISYYDHTNRDLKYAEYVGTGGNCGPSSDWQCDIIDDNATYGSDYYVGRYTSLATVGGSPAISYQRQWVYYDGFMDTYNTWLMYAVRVGGGGGNCGPGSNWQCDTIQKVQNTDFSPMSGFSTSLAEADGSAAIAYTYGYIGSQIRYAADVGSGGNCGPGNSWQCDNVVTSSSPAPALAVIDGNPAIAYYNSSSTDLVYAVYVGSGSGDCGTGNHWQCTTYDEVGTVGQYASLAEWNGQSIISYYDATNDDLKFATPGSVTVYLHWTAATPR